MTGTLARRIMSKAHQVTHQRVMPAGGGGGAAGKEGRGGCYVAVEKRKTRTSLKTAQSTRETGRVRAGLAGLSSEALIMRESVGRGALEGAELTTSEMGGKPLRTPLLKAPAIFFRGGREGHSRCQKTLFGSRKWWKTLSLKTRPMMAFLDPLVAPVLQMPFSLLLKNLGSRVPLRRHVFSGRGVSQVVQCQSSMVLSPPPPLCHICACYARQICAVGALQWVLLSLSVGPAGILCEQ